MVEPQGEQLDDIQHYVMIATGYVKDGTCDLRTTKNYQKSSRKWMCVGLILLLILIVLVVIPIATSFSHS
uniref:t-SNARE coiled-coil homology domain-containing protein n=1 Tax=Nelumbo nucifera TaxID=4432 RepID=A0A822YYY8_NELNU|nr:TPA_asm: hypothetical protein HUJ06_007110 [Nelumbo nucifera]